MLAMSRMIVTGLTIISTSRSTRIAVCISMTLRSLQLLINANSMVYFGRSAGFLPAPVVRNARYWAKRLSQSSCRIKI